MRGVSTRPYRDVLPQRAETVGLSQSAISRGAIEARAAQLEARLARRWDQTERLVMDIEGMRFGAHPGSSAGGVDAQGNQQVLGRQLGATENTAAVQALLVHLREHGVSSEKRYWFVIDGAKALRAGIEEVCGSMPAVERCRTHKIRNVLEQLPKEQHAPVRSLMRAAYKLPKAAEGMARREKMAQWLEREYPDAAASLREGLEETFTINRLDLPPSLQRCLASTNLMESPPSGVRKRTGNVCRWRAGDMVMRWVAGAYLITEKNFRKIAGYENLWALAAALGRAKKSASPQEQVA